METTLTPQQVAQLPDDHPKLRPYRFNDDGDVIDPPRIGHFESLVTEASLSGDNDKVAQAMAGYRRAQAQEVQSHNDRAENLQTARNRHWQATAQDDQVESRREPNQLSGNRYMEQHSNPAQDDPEDPCEDEDVPESVKDSHRNLSDEDDQEGDTP